MTDAEFADNIMVPELHEAGLIVGNEEYDEAWIDELAAIVKPRTKFPADVVTVSSPSSKRPTRSNMTRSRLTKASLKKAWARCSTPHVRCLKSYRMATGQQIGSMPSSSLCPKRSTSKKRIVFQAIRVAECGNMVSPPLGETMALIGRDDCLARIDRARSMAQ